MFYYAFIQLETTRSDKQSVAECARDLTRFLTDVVPALAIADRREIQEGYIADIELHGCRLELFFFRGAATRFYRSMVVTIRVSLHAAEAGDENVATLKERLFPQLADTLSGWPETDRLGTTEFRESEEAVPYAELTRDHETPWSPRFQALVSLASPILLITTVIAAMHFWGWVIDWRSAFGATTEAWSHYVLGFLEPVFRLLSKLPLIPELDDFGKSYLTVGALVFVAIELARNVFRGEKPGAVFMVIVGILTVVLWPVIIIANFIGAGSSDQTSDQKYIFYPMVLAPHLLVLMLMLVNLGIGFFSAA